MSRKTIKVDELMATVNESLAKSTCAPDIRQGMMNVLEHVLNSTDNYRGFRYLTLRDVPAGEKPGINYKVSNGVQGPHPDYTKRFENTDSTRVQYI